MEILDSSQMYYEDNYTIKNYIPSILLMERASYSFYEVLKEEINIENKKILVVCGSGNNGGDGFAIARILKADILFIGNTENFSNETKLNFDIAKKLNLKFVNNIENYNIIIDAIFGIGLNKEISGKHYEIIEKINNSNSYIASVDISSGVNASDGKIMGIAVKSDLCVSFHKAKLGHFLYPARNYYKKLIIKDIGIPYNINYEKNIKRETLKKENIILKNRNPNIHKGMTGKVLIIAGSLGMSGAAYMSATSCLNAGAGVITLAIPKSINHILEEKTTEIMTLALAEMNNCISYEAYDEIENFINKFDIDTVLIGPGLRRNNETMELVNEIIKNYNGNIILDADGLYAVKDNLSIIKNKNIILTPHYGEFLALLNKKEIDNKLKEAENFALKYNINLVLKGADTIITNGRETYINTSGNPGMAVAGMGDVLAGMISSFASQGQNLMEASKNAVYIHGYTGDKLLEEIAEEGIKPSLIMEKLPYIMKEFKRFF